MKAIRLYAQVLIDVIAAPQSGASLDSVKAELGVFVAAFKESPVLLRVFDDPTLAEDEKLKILSELNKKQTTSPVAARFLGMLIKRNRMGILNEIVSEIETIQIEKSGSVVGELVTAVPVDAQVVSAVSQALSKKLNKPVQLKEKVDPGIIAGMRVTIGGVTYDGSVKSKLDKLAGSFR